MDTRPLGTQGLVIPRIGLGVMSLAFYGKGDGDEEAASLAAIAELVRLCAPKPAFIDTAWIYSNAATGLHSESVVGKAIATHGRDKFIIATKFGSGGAAGAPNSSKETILKQYGESVARLGTTPDLYYQHRPDATRDVTEVVADLREMVADGRIKYIGLSECTPVELRRAHAVHPITAIQMEYSIVERGIEKTLLPVARELGVGIVCYSPLVRGLATGAISRSDVAGDRRGYLPRFSEENFDKNVAKFASLNTLASSVGMTAAQFCLAWLLKQGPDIFPIPGTKTVSRVTENVASIHLAERLTPAILAQVESLGLSVEGDRYPEAGMKSCFEARL